MNVLRPTNIVKYTLSSYDNLVPDPTLTYAVGGITGYIKKVDLTSFSYTTSISLNTSNYRPQQFVFDGTNWWFFEINLVSPFNSYLSCANFTGGSIIHRITTSFGSAAFICVIGGNLYLLGKIAGIWKLNKYDLTGAAISSTTIPTIINPQINFGLGLVNNNYIWCIENTGTNSDTVYRIDTSANVTSISTGLDPSHSGVLMFQDSVIGTRINFFGAGSSPASWGYIDTTGTTFTLVGSGIITPSTYVSGTIGNLQGQYEIDSNNWLTGLGSRVNKLYGTEDITTVSGVEGKYILEPSTGNFIIIGSDIYQLSFTADNNPITLTTSYQETSLTAVTSSASTSTIHNFQFTGTAGDVLQFTVDTAVDSNAAFTGFLGSTVPFISIHDSNEQRITYVSGKTLNWTVPSTGSYTVRFQLDPAHALHNGSFKLGYIRTEVANFTASPFGLDSNHPQLVGQTITFTDISTSNPSSWSWDFGDTNTSTDQNPTHTYTSPGTYTVTLTVT